MMVRFLNNTCIVYYVIKIWGSPFFLYFCRKLALMLPLIHRSSLIRLVNGSLALFCIILFVFSCKSPEGKLSKKDDNHLYTNHLINESSPYLLQHAHNPVNWVAWGDEAFETAKKEDKLVLVYSNG